MSKINENQASASPVTGPRTRYGTFPTGWNPAKGDSCYVVSMAADDGVATAYARLITLQSWGKTQGHAVRTQNGKLLRERLYVAYTVLCLTREEVEAWAATHLPGEAERSRLASLNIQRDWLVRWSSQAKVAVVENAKAKVAKLESEPSRYSINWMEVA